MVRCVGCTFGVCTLFLYMQKELGLHEGECGTSGTYSIGFSFPQCANTLLVEELEHQIAHTKHQVLHG